MNAASQPPVIPPQSVDKNLTPREWQVLEKVAHGNPNKVIAAEMNVSEHTVKLHIHNLLKKIGVSNRTGAANWFAQLQMLNPTPQTPLHD